MKVRDLIAALQLEDPDAEVLGADVNFDSDPFAVTGISPIKGDEDIFIYLILEELEDEAEPEYTPEQAEKLARDLYGEG